NRAAAGVARTRSGNDTLPGGRGGPAAVSGRLAIAELRPRAGGSRSAHRWFDPAATLSIAAADRLRRRLDGPRLGSLPGPAVADHARLGRADRHRPRPWMAKTQLS